MTADRLGTIDRLRELERDVRASPMKNACCPPTYIWADTLAEILAALTPAAGGADTVTIPRRQLEGWRQSLSICPTAIKQEMWAVISAAAAPPPADAVRALVGKVEPRPAKAHTPEAEAFNEGWNACLAAMSALSAAPAGEVTFDVTHEWAKSPAAAPTPEVGRRHDPRVEDAARAIYDAMPYDEPGVKPAWVPHGNSIKQDEARTIAREQITQQEGGRHG